MSVSSGYNTLVKLINLKNGNYLSKDAKEMKSFLDLVLGLLRKSNPRSLLFKTRFGIHTFFLKEPIDVIVLDRQFRVVKLRQNLQPNRLFFWNPKFTVVIELPSNTIRRSKTTVGDRIQF